MFRLGVIEESLESPNALEMLKPFFFSQKIEEIPDDTTPMWHINEYHIPNEKINDFLPILEQQVKPAWYIHAFNNESLIVIMRGKSFRISPRRDETWDEMITYGDSVQVERRYSESIPLSV